MLCPLLKCLTKLCDEPIDVLLLSYPKLETERRKLQTALEYHSNVIKIIILDGAEEILQTKSDRD